MGMMDGLTMAQKVLDFRFYHNAVEKIVDGEIKKPVEKWAYTIDDILVLRVFNLECIGELIGGGFDDTLDEIERESMIQARFVMDNLYSRIMIERGCTDARG